eukprot:TRINITY_DN123_c0_g1_i7.p1 TRINITY_DN123_c0_g1~~TRINITY_DN123_c0_g1_i7.p1  ORF type:complete len:293 (-),score=57.22 TRINITY_DN123_c0_g1_i7:57-935(-)
MELQEAIDQAPWIGGRQILKLIVDQSDQESKPQMQTKKNDFDPSLGWSERERNPGGLSKRERNLGRKQKAKILAGEGMVLMQSKDFVGAKKKFEEQLSLFRKAELRRDALYELACCEAALGNFDLSLQSLSEAVKCGFSDVAMMKNDDNLKNLQQNPTFTSILSKLDSSAVAREVVLSQSPIKGRQQMVRGLDLMATGHPKNLRKALKIFLKNSSKCPYRRGKNVPLFHAACCASMLGETDQAMKLIRESVEMGYEGKIEQEKNLSRLWGMDEFKQLVSSMREKEKYEVGVS